MQLVAGWVLAAVLGAAALLKLASPRTSRAALATFGIRDGAGRTAAWVGVVGAELALAAGVAAGITLAAYGAAALLVVFAVALAVALARGRGGAPCACFGARSRVTRAAVARTLVLAAAFAAVPSLPDDRLSGQAWFVLGLAVALLGVAVLAIATIALAREVGLLRLQLAPQPALEIPDEGPPLGERSELIERFPLDAQARFALAVFTSEGCALCRTLAPAIGAIGRDPLVALETFDEVADADAWERAAIPGSPFAVVLARDGVVLAKGTFNNRAQLEGLLAAAERRSAAAVGG